MMIGWSLATLIPKRLTKRSAMDIEQRVAVLEQDIATSREVIAALTGGQQALMSGLQIFITESHPAARSAEMQRAIDERGDLLQALAVSDALLDQTDAARQAVGAAIHAA